MKKIKSIKKLPMKDYCIYVDTDSLFFSAVPIVQKQTPNVDINDDKQMTEQILKIASDVQEYINKGYDVMALRMFNLKSHRFEIKQEVIAKSALWLRKKRYAQWVINEGGVVKDELEVKGLDTVRSSFPEKFRSVMKEILVDILKDVPKEDIDQKILDFKNNIKSYDAKVISRNSSVKELSKYDKLVVREGCVMGEFPKVKNDKGNTVAFPVHVKSAINYNNLLQHWGLDKKYPPIVDMEKVLWCYLKPNRYGLSEISFKGYNDPKRVVDFIKENIDKLKIFNKEFATKIYISIGKEDIDFYKALGWAPPSNINKTMNKFFT